MFQSQWNSLLFESFPNPKKIFDSLRGIQLYIKRDINSQAFPINLLKLSQFPISFSQFSNLIFSSDRLLSPIDGTSFDNLTNMKIRHSYDYTSNNLTAKIHWIEVHFIFNKLWSPQINPFFTHCLQLVFSAPFQPFIDFQNI